MNKNVLLTGGADLIGSNLLLKLITEGYYVIAASDNIFNVRTDNAVTVKLVVEEFLACYKKDTNVTITRNYHLSDIRHNFANTTKISTLLNFKPPITFKEGIKEFVHWVNTQTIKKDRYHESIAEMKQKGLFK